MFAVLLPALAFSQKEIRLQDKEEQSVMVETTRILRILLDNDTLWACKNLHVVGDTLTFESKYMINPETNLLEPNKKDFYVVDPFAKDTVISVPMSKVKMLECTKKSLEKYYYYRYFNMHRIEPLLMAFLVGGGIAGGLSAIIIKGVSIPNLAVCGIAVSLLAWRIVKVNVVCGTKKYYTADWSVHTDSRGGDKAR